METARPVLTADIPRDEHGRLAGYVPCIGCGYNLRGLRPEDLCPECAAPIARSTMSRRLSCAPPDWLSGLVRGMSWLMLGELIAYTWYFLHWLGWHPFSYQLIAFPALFICAVGIWLLTTPDPAALEHHLDAGSVLRGAVAAEFLLRLGTLPLWSWLGGMGSPQTMAAIAFYVIMATLGTTAYVAMFIYMRPLLMRVPSAKLVRRLGIVLVASIIVLLLGHTVYVLIWARALQPGGPPMTLLGLSRVSSGLMILVGFWRIWVWLGCRNALRRCLREAVTVWAAESSGGLGRHRHTPEDTPLDR